MASWPDAQSIPASDGEGAEADHRFFLAGPDDVERPTYVGSGETTVDPVPSDTDVLDELQIFITYRPAWVDKKGWPLSWQHYIYGLRHIARERLREQVWIAQAMRMSRTPGPNWDEWQRDMNRLTEVPKHG